MTTFEDIIKILGVIFRIQTGIPTLSNDEPLNPFDAIEKWLTDVSDAVKDLDIPLLSDILDGITEAVSGLSDNFQDTIIDPVKDAVTDTLSNFTWLASVWQAIRIQIHSALIGWLNSVFTTIGGLL